ncbi:MAG: hypothetical protein ACE5I1_08595, partial [bacterium]
MIKENFLSNFVSPTKRRFLSARNVFIFLLSSIFVLDSCALFKSNASVDVSKLTHQEILAEVEKNNQRIQTLSGKGMLMIEMPETPFKG